MLPEDGDWVVPVEGEAPAVEPQQPDLFGQHPAQQQPQQPPQGDWVQPHEVGFWESLGNSAERGARSFYRNWQGLPGQLQGQAMAEDIQRRIAAGEDSVWTRRFIDNPELLETLRQQYAENAAQALPIVAEQNRRIQELPQHPAAEAMQRAQTWGEAWDHFTSAPLQVIANIGLESLVQQAPSLAAGAVAGGVGGLPALMATIGLGSAHTEYMGGIFSALSEEGVDITNPEALRAALLDQELMGRVRHRSAVKAGVVGLFDAGSAGLASRVLLPAATFASRPVARHLTNVGVQVPAQGAMGGAGEALGSVASGQDVSPGAVMGEIVGEAFGAPAEVAAARHARRPAPPTPPVGDWVVPAEPAVEPAAPTPLPSSGPQAAITGFYSPAERAVTELPRKQGPAQAWFNDLKKRGVSDDELDWMGLPQFMEENRGRPISREEMAEFIRENGAQLEEVVQDFLPPKREPATTVAGQIQAMNELLQMQNNPASDDRRVKFFSNFPAGTTNPRNFLVRLPGLNYESPHFGGPTVSFIRVADTVGPNGEKTLLVHGNQSELHQEAEKQGYSDEVSPNPRGWETTDGRPAFVPNAPLKGDRWWQLGLKLALRQAVAEGYDAVAISTADQVKATDGNAPTSLYDKKMPTWLGKYVRPMGGEVASAPVPSTRGKTFDSLEEALSVFPRGSITQGISPVGWTVHAPGRRTIFGRAAGDKIGVISKAFNRFHVIANDSEIMQSLRIPDSRPTVLITPKMRESISKGQPLFAAHNSPTSEDAQTRALNAVNDGETADIPIKVADGILNDIRSGEASLYLRMVPSEYEVGSLVMLEPAGENVRAVFLTTNDTYTSMLLPRNAIDSLGALHVSPGYTDSGVGGLFFLRFDLPGEFGKRLAGELRHEAGHALRSSGKLSGQVWQRLLGHARSLSSMGMSVRDYLFAKRDAYWQGAPETTTVNEAYTRIYSGRPDFQEVMDQEHVMIMLELHHHGYFSDADVAPVMDIIRDMEAGVYSGGGVMAGAEPAMAIAGERAKTASKGNLAQAQKMTQRGRNPNTIWEATGWGLDIDNKWKWEIDDSKAKLINLGAHLKPVAPSFWQGLLGKRFKGKRPRWATAKTRMGMSIKLPQLLQHPELYKAYPFLERLRINLAIGQDIDREALGGMMATTKDGSKTIIRPIRVIAATESEAISTLLHEIQHVIQRIEGFAPGASARPDNKELEVGGKSAATFSPDTLNARMSSGDNQGVIDMTRAEDIARSIRSEEERAEPNQAELNRLTNTLAELLRLRPTDYSSSAGETESRTVEERRSLTAAQRRERIPFGQRGDRTPIRQTNSFPTAADETARRAALMERLQEARQTPVLIGDNLYAHRVDDETVVYTDRSTPVLTANLGRFDSIIHENSALIGPYSSRSDDPLEQSRNWNSLTPERKAYIKRQVTRDVRSRNYDPIHAENLSKQDQAKYGMPRDLKDAHLDPPAWRDSAQFTEGEHLYSALEDAKRKLEQVSADGAAKVKQAEQYYERIKKSGAEAQDAWDALLRAQDEANNERLLVHDEINDIREQITLGPLNDMRLEYEALRKEAQELESVLPQMRADLAKENSAFRKAIAKLILRADAASTLSDAEEGATSFNQWENAHYHGWATEGEALATQLSPAIKMAEDRYRTVMNSVYGTQADGDYRATNGLIHEIEQRGGTVNYGRDRMPRYGKRRGTGTSGPMFAISGGPRIPSALSFIREHGGIKDENGELKAILDRPGRGSKGYLVGIVNNKTGVPLDRMRELMVEAGYIQRTPDNRPDETSIQDVLDIIRRIKDGEKVAPLGFEIELLNERDSAIASENRDQILREAEVILATHGMPYDLSETEEARLVELVEGGMAVDDALEQATIETINGRDESEAAAADSRGVAEDGGQAPEGEFGADRAGIESAPDDRAREARAEGGLPTAVTPPPVPVVPPPLPVRTAVPPPVPPGSKGGTGGRGGPPPGDIIPPAPPSGPPGPLPAPNIIDADVRRSMRDRVNSFARAMNTWWNPMNGLPELEQYRIGRYKMLGRIDHGERMTEMIWKDFKGASKADKKAAYTFLTTRGTTSGAISDPKVRQAAEATKHLFNGLGTAAVERGLIPQEAFDKYRDQYLPRLYLKHILSQGSVLGFAGNARPSDLGWTKHRKDIDKETRILMGEVMDPGFLAARGIFRMHRDMSIIDFLDHIAGNDQWVFRDTLVNFNGRLASPYYLRSEATALRERARYEPNETYKNAMKLMAEDMDAVASPLIRKDEKVPDGYVQIPDSKRYGMLRGMYVRKEIRDDLLPTMTLLPADVSTVEAWFSPGGAMTRVNSLWKAMKVPLNPATQVRNVMSNAIMMYLSGMSPLRVKRAWSDAGKEIASSGPLYKKALDMGLKASGFSEQEVIRLTKEWAQVEKVEAEQSAWGPLKLAFLFAKHQVAGVTTWAGDKYQYFEGRMKLAMMIDAVKNEGMTPEQGFLKAQDWLFDYSDVHKAVRYARNAPIGMPFITYYYKALPKLLEVAATRPLRFLPFVALPYIMAQAFAHMWEVDDDDVEKLRQSLPEYMRKKSSAFILPWRDEHGRWQFFDFGYLLPWSMFWETGQAIASGNITGIVKESGLLGGPILDVISAIKTGGVDPFTQRPIFDKRDPPEKRAWDIASYVWRLAMPPWLTDQSFLLKMRDAYAGTPDRYGEPGLTMGQAALRGAGLNVSPVDPEATRARTIAQMQRDIRDAQIRMRSQLRNQSLSETQRQTLQQQYVNHIAELRRRMSEYSANSDINPRLRRVAPDATSPAPQGDWVVPQQQGDWVIPE